MVTHLASVADPARRPLDDGLTPQSVWLDGSGRPAPPVAFFDRIVAAQHFEPKLGSLSGADLLLDGTTGVDSCALVEAKMHCQRQADGWQTATASTTGLAEQSAALKAFHAEAALAHDIL